MSIGKFHQLRGRPDAAGELHHVMGDDYIRKGVSDLSGLAKTNSCHSKYVAAGLNFKNRMATFIRQINGDSTAGEYGCISRCPVNVNEKLIPYKVLMHNIKR